MRHIRTALTLGAIGSAAFATPAFAAPASPPPCSPGSYAPCAPGQGQGTPPGQGGGGNGNNGNGNGNGNNGQPGNGNGNNTGAPGKAEKSKSGSANKNKAAPGEQVTVSGPANTFKQGSTVNKGITGSKAKGPKPQNVGTSLGTAKAGSDGSISTDVTIPADAEQGVYFIYLTGVDANNETVVVIIPIVVPTSAPSTAAKSASTNTAGGGTTGKAASAETSAPPTFAGSESEEVPVSVAALRVDAPVEEAMVDAVTDDGAVLRIDNGQLIAASSDGDDTRPLVAAFAIGLAGGGVVLLRRRSSLNMGVAR